MKTELAARPVTDLRDAYKGQPVLVLGNGTSRAKTPLPWDSVATTIGANGVIFEERVPSFVLFNVHSFLRHGLNERKSRGLSTAFLVPEHGDWGYRGTNGASYTFRRASDPVWPSGVFRGGMIGCACVDLALLIGADPIILAGFDGDTKRFHEHDRGYGRVAENFEIQRGHKYVINALENSGRSVFVAYPHGNLPFGVWHP